MSEHETWFEVRVPMPLAVLLQRVTNAYLHSGKTRRSEISDGIEGVITRRLTTAHVAELEAHIWPPPPVEPPERAGLPDWANWRAWPPAANRLNPVVLTKQSAV